jgi:Concanavalin A-like lectin/glucanases superfamily/Domain of unknown function (DUF2341)
VTRGSIFAWGLLGLTACTLGWDALDPRLAEQGGVGGAGASGGAVATGGAASTGGGGTTISGPGGGGAGPWYDRALARRREVVATLPAASEPLAGFPVLVVLDGETIDDSPDGSDIRVVADDHSTLLAHEIDHYAGAAAALWVRLPSVQNTPTRFWLYYGGSPTEPALAETAVWSNAFAMVHHLEPDLANAAGSDLAGTGVGTDPVSGRIGSAQEFVSDDRIDLGQASALDSLFHDGGTITVWIKPETSGELQRGRILDRSSSVTFDGGWALLMSDFSVANTVGLGFGYDVDFAWWTTPVDSVTYGAWQHVAASFLLADGEPALYLDGQATTVTVGNSPVGVPHGPSPLPARIGNAASSTNRDFVGQIDEIRVSSVVRSPTWIAAEALAESLTVLGPEQAGP